ncbi:MAG: hypothetical protein M0D57_09275 [Sphingobacteriales bacterium JAD_PAG50586_3]|nr:MAG: hypothetical protein M0D57_09275 [Sphingobacteriales bacterium JAD_PAG50586_3]
MPTINVFSKKENTESFTVIIISGDTLSDPRSKMHIGNAYGSMYAHFGSGPIYGKNCNIITWVNMEIFKKMSNPKRSFKIFYYKDQPDLKGEAAFEDKFKPNLTSITINVLNE